MQNRHVSGLRYEIRTNCCDWIGTAPGAPTVTFCVTLLPQVCQGAIGLATSYPPHCIGIEYWGIAYSGAGAYWGAYWGAYGGWAY